MQLIGSPVKQSNLSMALWKFDKFIILSPDLHYKTSMIAESTQLDHLNKQDLVLSVIGGSKRREKVSRAEKYDESSLLLISRNTHWLYTTDWEKMEMDILRKRGLLSKDDETRYY